MKESLTYEEYCHKKQCFDTLGITEKVALSLTYDDLEKEINKKYRSLARRYHPDKVAQNGLNNGLNDEYCKKLFSDLSNARSILIKFINDLKSGKICSITGTSEPVLTEQEFDFYNEAFKRQGINPEKVVNQSLDFILQEIYSKIGEKLVKDLKEIRVIYNKFIDLKSQINVLSNTIRELNEKYYFIRLSQLSSNKTRALIPTTESEEFVKKSLETKKLLLEKSLETKKLLEKEFLENKELLKNKLLELNQKYPNHSNIISLAKYVLPIPQKHTYKDNLIHIVIEEISEDIKDFIQNKLYSERRMKNNTNILTLLLIFLRISALIAPLIIGEYYFIYLFMASTSTSELFKTLGFDSNQDSQKYISYGMIEETSFTYLFILPLTYCIYAKIATKGITTELIAATFLLTTSVSLDFIKNFIYIFVNVREEKIQLTYYKYNAVIYKYPNLYQDNLKQNNHSSMYLRWYHPFFLMNKLIIIPIVRCLVEKNIEHDLMNYLKKLYDSNIIGIFFGKTESSETSPNENLTSCSSTATHSSVEGLEAM